MLIRRLLHKRFGHGKRPNDHSRWLTWFGEIWLCKCGRYNKGDTREAKYAD